VYVCIFAKGVDIGECMLQDFRDFRHQTLSLC